jgi:hypothetical protein
VALGEGDEGVEEVFAVFGGGEEVAAYRAELLGSGESAQQIMPGVAPTYMAHTDRHLNDLRFTEVG